MKFGKYIIFGINITGKGECMTVGDKIRSFTTMKFVSLFAFF